MWLISLVVVPTKECTIAPYPEWGAVKGAYVNALISFPELDDAKCLAKMYATEGDKQWKFHHFRSCRKVTLANFKDDSEYQDYFAKAEKDGYALVYHLYGDANQADASSDAASFTAAP